MVDRVVYFGTANFSVPILRRLNQHYSIRGIVTQPDKQQGRGKKILFSPLKNASIDLDIPIFQPTNLTVDTFLGLLTELNPDCIIVAAYGKILPKWILDFPKLGCINVHASLLPRWRGASPIQASILAGDVKTGVSIMLMDEGMDTGVILDQKGINIGSKDTYSIIESKLSLMGADLLVDKLPLYAEGKIKPIPQDEEKATYCSLIKKEDGRLDFNHPAHLLERQIRAYNPWPICFMNWDSNNLKVYCADVSETRILGPFERGVINRLPAVGTAYKDLLLVEVQSPGKRIMSGREFLNGARDWENKK